MARKNGNGVGPAVASASPVPTALTERRVPTPNRNLMVIKIGEPSAKAAVAQKVPTSRILARVAKVMAKPGTDRTRVFQSTSNKAVYAYSIDANDPTRVVREDAAGQRTVGRLVGGRFRSSLPSRAV